MRVHTANAKLPLVSETDGKMSDDYLRPGQPDSMACFAHPTSADKCILMRNHENWNDITGGSPFGPSNELLSKLDPSNLYDKKADGSPFLGGVTKVIYDLKNKRLETDFLVLTGTTANCAGSATPWGSWLTCEKEMLKPSEGSGKYHGFVFETPASSVGLVDPVPLKDMGRFAHEAAAVDPKTGIVYLTEDNRRGLFYRFLPNNRGEMHKGGKLQAPAIKGWKSANTANWPQDCGGGSSKVKNSRSCG